MSIRKTTVAIDEDLFSAVRAALGTETLKDTIDRAFREIVMAQARRAEVEALAKMSGMDLNDERVMAKAWRK